MAEAKTPVTSTETARVSKRKTSAARKTKKVKTKITKTQGAGLAAAATRPKEREKHKRVLTERHRRMLEKARVRESMPVAEPPPPEMAAVKITDIAGVVYEPADYQAMVDMYDSTIKDIKEGEVVAGTVMGVTRDDVIIDVGFKSEGIIPLNEFPKPLNIAVGENIEVFLEQIEDANGQLVLSKQKADFMRVWDNIRDVHDSGNQIEGRVVRRIKGGLVVDIQGVDAFLPGSQVALRQVPDFDALIGEIMELKIIKINKSRRNIVVSRRMILEEKRETMRASLLSEIGIGQIRQGIVKNITDFGVFIDLGGVDGLLHITDMSWGRIRHPSEVVSLSAQIDVKVLDFDEKTSRISLGLKQMTPYPWENIEQKYPLGRKVTGRVVSITDYGAFVELEKGVEGLIHISEMSWTQHIKHPSKIMNVNDQVEAVVLSVDKDNEKISLGIKQMEPDPWTTIEDKYPPGSVVSGKVRNLTAFGAFVELEEGIDGLVHISDMSWTRRIQHPSEVMKKGTKLEVKILKVDHEHRRISLGYKQLTQDPWPEISRKYAVGTDCLGSISRVLDRGVVVDLDGDVEGFVPTAQLGHKELKDATGVFAEGESIPLQVTELDKNQRKVVLSVIAYYKKRERTEFDEFLAKHEPQAATLGDAMPEELKAKAETTAAPPAEEKAQPEGDAAADETINETPAAEDTPVVEQPPVEATPAEADVEAAAETEVADAPESEASTPEDSEETPKQEE
ncbi:MAG: 30S ribosomal protein S1 [candidate division Zixibacteria bacterium]|nr:30S ribosomal protein S1 [candidate division Zixibacteria bacterium]